MSVGNPNKPNRENESPWAPYLFIPLLTHRTMRYMKRRFYYAILELVRYDATETLLHCLGEATRIECKCQPPDQSKPIITEYEQKPLDIRLIE